MPDLPTQLPWRRFACVLRKLGYTAQKGKAGAARRHLKGVQHELLGKGGVTGKIVLVHNASSLESGAA